MRSSTWTLSCMAMLGTALAQLQFNIPNPNLADLSETWTVGDTINITWKAGGNTMDRADLWVTWFRSDAFSQLLKEDVAFNEPGTFPWKVNISNSVIKTSPQFVIRLKPHTSPPLYAWTEQQSSSRGFILLPGSSPSSTTTSATSSSTSTTTATAPATSASEAPPTRSSPAPPPPPSSGLNTGALVGGVIGGVLGAVAIAALAWYVLARRRRLAHGHHEYTVPKEMDASAKEPAQYAYRAEPVEIGVNERVAEIGANDRVAEVEGGGVAGRGEHWN